MQGSAWLQDVKPRGATGPRFRFEAHLRHRDPAELRGPQPQQQDGLTRFRCTIQAPPRGCFVRSTFLRGSEHRRPPMPWGSGPARCRHATACMGFSINRFARWWHARDLHDRGAVSEDSITSTSPMLEGGTSSSHAGSSRWPRRSQRRADSLDGDAIQADRGSMASARSAQVASPPGSLECVPPSTTVQPGPSDRVLMSDPPVMREGPPAMTGPPMRRRAQPNQAEVAWEEVSDYGHGDRTR